MALSTILMILFVFVLIALGFGAIKKNKWIITVASVFGGLILVVCLFLIFILIPAM